MNITHIKRGKLSLKDCWSLLDYHERTGQYPKGITDEDFEKAEKRVGKIERELEVDPSGGFGINSHI